jgi:hypothetical protein
VDLASYVKGKTGTFYLSIESQPLQQEVSGLDGLRVFFISRGVKRKIGKESLGAGCDTLMDISNLYAQNLSRGFKLAATQQRYVSVLAGTYYFIWPIKEVLNVGTVTLEDSRYPDLECSAKAG